MMRKSTLSLSCALMVVVIGTTDLPGAVGESGAVPAAAQRLLDDYGGLRVYMDGADVRAFYGQAMTSAETPERAAAWWLEDHSAALGVESVDLQLMRSNTVNPASTFTVFVYQQYLSGLPVEFGHVRVLVRNGVPSSVVYVGATLARAPVDGYPADTTSGDSALASVQAMADYAHLSEWTEPELVVYFGDDPDVTAPSVRAWEFQGTHPVLSEFERYSFFVNAADGKLVHVRNDVYNVEVEGHVSGMATPGTFPDSATNPPVEMDMEDVESGILQGESVYSDENGDFVIPNEGDTEVTVVVRPFGRWVTVDNDTGANIFSQLDVLPPGPADMMLNPAPIETTTSQTNAHIHTTLIHDFYKDRQPDYNGLDLAITANVNINSTCNAFFSGLTINFYKSQSPNGCPNTAYTTVIAHEYGHFVVAQHNLGQGSFGEGFGDAIGAMLYDDPGTGEDFFGPGQGPLRSAETVINYPCTGPIHTCGQTLSGVWWQIRIGLGDLMGEEAGLILTQQMFTDWMEITNGGLNNDSAHPLTAIEVLTIDDDDANIDNGTPNFGIICDAFDSRNIDCPELNLLSFEYPNGLPDLLVPNSETIIEVNVVGISADPAPGTGTVSYSIDGGEFTTVAMAEGNPNEYEATLPALDCVQSVDYYFSAETMSGSQIDDPEGAPNPAFFAVAAEGQDVVVALDFEEDAGWTVESDVELFNGVWERDVPVGNGGDRGDPETDFDGSGKCYVTGSGPYEDVSGGATNLTSADYDLTALVDPQLSYARWYFNSADNYPEEDIFVIRVSDDGGMSWVDLEIVGPTGGEVHGGWFVKTFRISDYVDITDQFRILFIASDEGGNSVIEAGIDAFEIFEYLCGGEDCEGDANGDGVVDPLDSGYVLSRFGCEVGGGDPTCDIADMNGDGLVDPLDVGFILSRFGPCD